MSDITANQPPEAAAAPDAALTEAETPPEGGWTDEYVHKLRDENASWRTKYKPFEDSFQTYAPEEVETFLEVAKALKSDPVAAADWFEAVAKEIKGGATPEAAAAEVTPLADGEKPLTRAEVEALFAERETAKETAKAQFDQVESVNAEIKTLGYDPNDADGIQLMWLAVNKTGGDLAAADVLVKAQRQAVIDEYVEGLKATANGTAGVVGNVGGIPSGERAIKNLDDAEKAMRARLDALR